MTTRLLPKVLTLSVLVSVSSALPTLSLAGIEPNRDGLGFDVGACGVVQPAVGRGEAVALSVSRSQTSSLTAPCVDCGEPVEYTAFDGTLHSLTRYEGAHVAILFPDAWLEEDGVPAADRRLFLDRADFFYEHASELIGREPAGTGKLNIAIVDPTCGLGCGYIGWKGIEILSTQIGLDHVSQALEVGLLPGAVEHEMIHNFDVFNAYLFSDGQGPDGHGWTDFIEYYLRLYARTGSVIASPERTMEDWLEKTLVPYLADPSANWFNCVATDSCPVEHISPNSVWSGVSNQFGVVHGPVAVRAMLAAIADFADTQPVPADLQARADLHIAAMAAAVGEDLRCYVDHWRWSIGPELASQLAAYPAAPFCADMDADGWSTLQGDCADDDSQINPDGLEVVNGLDDDCSGVVDDVAYVEPNAGDFAPELLVHFPSQIAGEITEDDFDAFSFALAAPSDIEFEICSDGFQGFLFVYVAFPDLWLGYHYVWEGECGRPTFFLDEARVWQFGVGLNVASHPGAYHMSVKQAEEWPPASPWGVPNAVMETEFPVTLGTSSVPTTPAFPPTHARFWISGLGFVATAPYEQGATASFDPGPNGGGEYTYRVQLLSAGVPATDWSSSVTFVPEPPQTLLLATAMTSLSLLAARSRSARSTGCAGEAPDRAL